MMVGEPGETWTAPVTVTHSLTGTTSAHHCYSTASQFPAVDFNHASRRSVDNTVTMYIVKPLATSVCAE